MSRGNYGLLAQREQLTNISGAKSITHDGARPGPCGRPLAGGVTACVVLSGGPGGLPPARACVMREQGRSPAGKLVCRTTDFRPGDRPKNCWAVHRTKGSREHAWQPVFVPVTKGQVKTGGATIVVFKRAKSKIIKRVEGWREGCGSGWHGWLHTGWGGKSR
jgi:hypothetical protein